MLELLLSYCLDFYIDKKTPRGNTRFDVPEELMDDFQLALKKGNRTIIDILKSKIKG